MHTTATGTSLPSSLVRLAHLSGVRCSRRLYRRLSLPAVQCFRGREPAALSHGCLPASVIHRLSSSGPRVRGSISSVLTQAPDPEHCMSLGCPRPGPGCPESRLDNLRHSGLRPVDGPRWHTSDGVTTATPWSSSRGGRPSGSGHTAVPEWPAAVPRAHSRTMPRLPAAPRHSARCDLLRPSSGRVLSPAPSPAR